MSRKKSKPNFLVLTDGGEREIEFELLDVISFLQNEYVVLYPIKNPDDEIVILQREDMGDGDFQYIGVEESLILEAVFALFKERNKDMFIK